MIIARSSADIKFSLRCFSLHSTIIIVSGLMTILLHSTLVLILIRFNFWSLLVVIIVVLVAFYFWLRMSILRIHIILLATIYFYILPLFIFSFYDIIYKWISRLLFLYISFLKSFDLYTTTLFHLRILTASLIVFIFCSLFISFSIFFRTTMANIHINNLHFLTIRNKSRYLSRCI